MVLKKEQNNSDSVCYEKMIVLKLIDFLIYTHHSPVTEIKRIIYEICADYFNCFCWYIRLFFRSAIDYQSIRKTHPISRRHACQYTFSQLFNSGRYLDVCYWLISFTGNAVVTIS